MSKKKWIIASVVMAILGAVVVIIKMRSKIQIEDVRWETKVPKHLDISWHDEDDDHIYKIFWSNQPGIKIDKPETYRHLTRVSTVGHHGRRLVRVQAPYDWCYFVISKDGSRTKEFEASVLQDSSFRRANLDPKIIWKDQKRLVFNVKVLDGAERYRLYQYRADGSVHTDDFDVRGLKTVDLRIPRCEDAFIFIASLIAEVESGREFLFFDENF